MRPVFAAPFLLCWSLLAFTTMSFAQTRDAVAIDLIAKTLSTMAVQVSPTLQTIAQGTITDSNGKAKSLTIETSGLDRLRNDVNTDFTFVSNAGGGFLSLDGKKHDLRT